MISTLNADILHWSISDDSSITYCSAHSQHRRSLYTWFHNPISVPYLTCISVTEHYLLCFLPRIFGLQKSSTQNYLSIMIKNTLIVIQIIVRIITSRNCMKRNQIGVYYPAMPIITGKALNPEYYPLFYC